jgi:hypothetical protein
MIPHIFVVNEEAVEKQVSSGGNPCIYILEVTGSNIDLDIGKQGQYLS